MNFSQRSDEKEIMDDQHVSAGQWALFIKDLVWINRYLMGHGLLTQGITTLYNRAEKSPVRVAEYACGGGNTLQAIAQWAKKYSKNLQFFGYDFNPVFVEYANLEMKNGLPIQFENQDIFADDFIEKSFDIILCNLFCHHLSNEQLVEFFKQVVKQARLGVIINDLHRHQIAYWGFNIISILKKFSPMVRHDGLVSIRRGFVNQELVSALQQAGVKYYKIKWCFPFYYNIIITNPKI